MLTRWLSDEHWLSSYQYCTDAALTYHVLSLTNIDWVIGSRTLVAIPIFISLGSEIFQPAYEVKVLGVGYIG